jgi:hypothetical protein
MNNATVTTTNAIEYKVGDKVAVVESSNVAYLGYIARETRAMWVVKRYNKNPSTELMYKKEAESTWQKSDGIRSGWGEAAKYSSIRPVDEKTQALIDKTNEHNVKAEAEAKVRRAAKKAEEDAQAAWLKSEAGKAQTSRYDNLTGLLVVVRYGQNNSIEDRSAQITLVGPYQRDHKSEVVPAYRYAEMDVRQSTPWQGVRVGEKEVVYKLATPEISTSSMRGSMTRIKNMQRMVNKAMEIAAEWDKDTGKVIRTREY